MLESAATTGTGYYNRWVSERVVTRSPCCSRSSLPGVWRSTCGTLASRR